MKNEEWVMPYGSIDRTYFNGLPVKVKTTMGVEDKGWLTVQETNDEGQIRIFASYNSSPFAGTTTIETFYLTQEQLNEFQEKGAMCVLVAPSKNSI